jgi:hypothetical protein
VLNSIPVEIVNFESDVFVDLRRSECLCHQQTQHDSTCGMYQGREVAGRLLHTAEGVSGGSLFGRDVLPLMCSAVAT